MNVTRDVIRDLLPVYLAGEASPDTRALVEEYARLDPEIRAAISDLQPVTLPPVEATITNREKETLRMTKRLLRMRSFLLALAVLCTSAPMSFYFRGDRIEWSMMRDAPMSAAIYAVLAVCFWIAYILVGRRLKVTGV